MIKKLAHQVARVTGALKRIPDSLSVEKLLNSLIPYFY